MADFDPNNVPHPTGQIFVNVTNLTAAPFGGAAVGFFENGQVDVSEESESIVSEATGKRVGVLSDVTFVGFEFDLVQYDTDMLAFPWAGSGGVQREPSLGGSSAPGKQVPQGPVLFLAADPLHPSFLLFAPVYSNGRKMIPFGAMEKRRERIYVEGCDDANGHTYAAGLLANLSLT